jgi:hypothetical protein
VNLIALRCFGPIGLCSFVAIRRRQRGQITTGSLDADPSQRNKHSIPERQVMNAAQLAALRAPSLSWTAVDANNVLGLHRSLRPCACKLDESLFLFLSFGLIGPAHCFLGILPELFRVFHCHPP